MKLKWPELTQEFIDFLCSLVIAMSYTDISTMIFKTDLTWFEVFGPGVLLSLGAVYVIFRFFGFRLIKKEVSP
ncbi:MAG TPA: hypothetical protein VGB32_05995 [Candidatus Bathyarchaeia archaeon]